MNLSAHAQTRFSQRASGIDPIWLWSLGKAAGRDELKLFRVRKRRGHHYRVVRYQRRFYLMIADCKTRTLITVFKKWFQRNTAPENK
jgi:hypothetical protein